MNLHLKQRKILKLLHHESFRRYSEIYDYFSEEDRFPYHLKQVLKKGLVHKEGSRYSLTNEGFKIAVNNVRQDYSAIEHKVPRIVLVCKTNRNKFLIKKYFNVFGNKKIRYGLPGIKMDFGTFPFIKSIEKQISSKFGIEGQASFRAIQSFIQIDKSGQSIFDFLYIVFNIQVNSVLSQIDGYSWLTEKQIKKLPPISYAIEDFLFGKEKSTFSERVVKEDEFV